MKTSLFTRFALLLGLYAGFQSSSAEAVSIPVFQDTSTTAKNTLTTALGKAPLLTVAPTQKGLIRFDLSQLPPTHTAGKVTSARLRIYVSRVIKSGDLTVQRVTQTWNESTNGTAPSVDASVLATVAASKLATKQFVIVDVTSTVKAWLAAPASNFGFALTASGGASATTRLQIGSKEGPAVGFPIELEVETGDGGGNTNAGNFSVIGGGDDNVIQNGAEFSTIPGGVSNEIGANADFSFAAGRRAVANHIGSFVWADSTNADFSSVMDNQFRVRANNGLSLPVDAGGGKFVTFGTYFRDNAIVAWGRIASNGALDTNFNIDSVQRVSAGRYKVNLRSGAVNGFNLIPVVTAEIDADQVTDVVPTGAANVRIVATNQVAGGDTFEIFVYNGSFNLVDNDVQFIVTGR